MKQFCVGLFFFLISGFALHAQEFPVGEKQTGAVSDSPLHPILKRNQVIQDSRINTLLQQHIAINKRRNGMDGYRLEIFFSSDYNAREKALEVKTEFLKRYPDLDAYIQFQAPNFRVRIGNFRTKSDASKIKERIKRYYPNAFRVDDIIQFPELITEERNQ
ncbi:MAG: SPOR domain-containing protein [Prolixibacteraceae bacterium]|jgi:hypothetical protein|nr:SPOR domain-containing protein [Prolixibacteraceae bacterium]